MRIGLSGVAPSVDRIIEQAQQAEADGFASLWYASAVAGEPSASPIERLLRLPSYPEHLDDRSTDKIELLAFSGTPVERRCWFGAVTSFLRARVEGQ
jgi:hypothetical protein